MMRSSYSSEDVTVLLKDISGQVTPLATATREKMIQGGTHYSEMLPLEYMPSESYLETYEAALACYGEKTAMAVAVTAEKIFAVKGENIVLVSLARAGVPIGILLKRYLENKYKIKVAHYAISIIRGRGIDHVAMRYILDRHRAEALQVVDGWIGKGAILKELIKELQAYEQVSKDMAVLSDPAYVTDLCGTHEDLLIPSSCLNATVSGLLSRTFLRRDLIGDDDFHGAAYYKEWAEHDLSYAFIDHILAHLPEEARLADELDKSRSTELGNKGLAEVQEIAAHFAIDDVNLVKPGIGETTRVLLRRVPWIILVKDKRDAAAFTHLFQLAKEKNVAIVEYPLRYYKACGIIKKEAGDV